MGQYPCIKSRPVRLDGRATIHNTTLRENGLKFNLTSSKRDQNLSLS